MKFKNLFAAALVAAFFAMPALANDIQLAPVAGASGGGLTLPFSTTRSGTLSATVAARFGNQFWFTSDFGGKCDGQNLSGISMTAGSAVVNGYAATAADVGKIFQVPGAGASGGYLNTTVASVSGGVATLAAAAQTSVSPTSFTATFSGTNMTVSQITSGAIHTGVAYVSPGLEDYTQEASQTSGTTGGTGVYVMSRSQASGFTTGAVAVTADQTAFIGTDNAPAIAQIAASTIPTTGGVLNFPDGICTTSATMTLYAHEMLQFAGMDITHFRQAPGMNKNLIQSVNYATLAGSGLNYGDGRIHNGMITSPLVPQWMSLRDVELDGDNSVPLANQFTATMSGTTLTLVTAPAQALTVGQNLYSAPPFPMGEKVVAILSGTGGVGSTYQMTLPATLSTAQGFSTQTSCGLATYGNELIQENVVFNGFNDGPAGASCSRVTEAYAGFAATATDVNTQEESYSRNTIDRNNAMGWNDAGPHDSTNENTIGPENNTWAIYEWGFQGVNGYETGSGHWTGETHPYANFSGLGAMFQAGGTMQTGYIDQDSWQIPAQMDIVNIHMVGAGSPVQSGVGHTGLLSSGVGTHIGMIDGNINSAAGSGPILVQITGIGTTAEVNLDLNGYGPPASANTALVALDVKANYVKIGGSIKGIGGVSTDTCYLSEGGLSIIDITEYGCYTGITTATSGDYENDFHLVGYGWTNIVGGNGLKFGDTLHTNGQSGLTNYNNVWILDDNANTLITTVAQTMSGALITPATRVTGNQTLTLSQNNVKASLTAAATLTMPTGAADGDTITIKNSTSSTAALTLVANTNDTMDTVQVNGTAVSTMAPGAAVVARYDGTLKNWDLN